MTIEEKAKEYAGTQDSDAYAGFVNGAEWMIENVAKWISKCAYEAQDCNYVKENGDHDVDLLLNNLRKALEK